MHTLVEMLYITRKEFERNLRGLTDEDARKRIEPMNCISWIIAHVANQHHSYFVAWPQGKDAEADGAHAEFEEAWARADHWIRGSRYE